MRIFAPTALCLALVACNHAQPAPTKADTAATVEKGGAIPVADRSWIDRSNGNAKILLEVQARFAPEQAARIGQTGLDDRITDVTPGHEERLRQATREALAKIEDLRRTERDPLVAQDLAILADAARKSIRGSELSERLEVPYHNLPRLIFFSVRSLLDPQIAAERRPAALARVRKYAGLEPGTTPVVELAERETRAALAKPGLLSPSRIQVENDLQTARFSIDGIEKLFQEYRIAGSEQPVAELKKQLVAYTEFVRTEVLPRARDDFRLPPELYAFRLEQVGVDIPAAQLTAMAHAAFTQIQGEMQAVATRVAKEKGISSTDYRDVIRALKKNPIHDEDVLAHYHARLKQIEDVIRAQRLVTLPSRPARIRLGTPAENAQQPAPHMMPPRLLGNTGEYGEFVIVTQNPHSKSGEPMDDFGHDAATWTLTTHEARPGHELQFASMVERGVSIARALFAFNSANVEGWGLYSEAIMFRYMPLEGQLVALQYRLLREARAFLDPMVNLGIVTPAEAKRVLLDDVVLSEPFAEEEVDRFAFWSPGQAPSYYYGFQKLRAVRTRAEIALGPRFDAKAFNDFIVSQGLLPPPLLERAVLEEFVPARR